MRDKDIRVRSESVVERHSTRRYRAYPPFQSSIKVSRGGHRAWRCWTPRSVRWPDEDTVYFVSRSGPSLDVAKDDCVNDGATSETTAHLQLLPAGSQVDVVRVGQRKRSADVTYFILRSGISVVVLILSNRSQFRALCAADRLRQ